MYHDAKSQGDFDLGVAPFLREIIPLGSRKSQDVKESRLWVRYLGNSNSAECTRVQEERLSRDHS